MTSPLKHILTGFVAIGVLALLYVLFSAMLSNPPRAVSDTGGSFEAHGDMARFVIVSERPEFPSAPFSNDAGAPVRVADFSGKFILVNLWATWCPPCLVEMPALDRLQAKLGGDQFEVVAISLDKNAQKARDWLKTNGINNLAFYNDQTLKLHEDFGAAGLPTSYLIDANGRLVGYLEGDAAWDADDAETLIEHFIETAN